MDDAELKQQWIAANALVERLDADRRKLLESSEQEWLAALIEFEKLDVLLDDHDTCIRCEVCTTPIMIGDRYHGGPTPTCEECAPSYQDLIDEPDSFTDGDGLPVDPEALKAEYDAHIANGGSADDKMVWPYG